jgi:MinD-like ATPase involved in chromosome partitioning or flagellar assembly
VVVNDDPLPVLTAVAEPSHEAALVAGFGRPELAIRVVRRCVDLVELLSAATAGTARAALVSADLRGLDRAALAHLAAYGVVTVGLAADEPGERLLHQLGAALVVPADAAVEQVAGALRAAAALPHTTAPATTDALDHAGPGGGGSTPAARGAAGPLGPSVEATAQAAGSVIAVWGPTGAPGRSTVALGVADALAAAGTATVLVDADPYGGCLAMLAGVLDEAPGVTAACRAGNAGSLDVARLADCCREVAPHLRLLSGISDAARWPELRPAALTLTLRLARRLAAMTIVDCGFNLEDDEELSYDTLAPRRNAATLAVLEAADRVLVVTSADPVGSTRTIRELPRLAAVLQQPVAELLESGRVLVVANRVRAGLTAGSPAAGVATALERHAGVKLVTALPLDQAAVDRASGRGQLLSEAAPNSALRAAFADLALQLTRHFGSSPANERPRRGHRVRRGRRALVSRG